MRTAVSCEIDFLLKFCLSVLFLSSLWRVVTWN